MANWWSWGSDEEAGRLEARELLREEERRVPEAPKAPPVPTPTPTPMPRPAPTPRPAVGRLPAFAQPAVPSPAPPRALGGPRLPAFAQPAGAEVPPRPSLFRPSTWPVTTGIPAGAGILQTPLMQTLMGAIGGPEAARKAEPAVAWQRWLSQLTRVGVAEPAAGELQMGGPARYFVDPEYRRDIGAGWADLRAGERTYGEVVGERAAIAREAWRQAPVSPVVRMATETGLDPFGVGGAVVAGALGAGLALAFPAAAGVLGFVTGLYIIADAVDMGGYLASATPEELLGVALFYGLARLPGEVVKLVEKAWPGVRRAAVELEPVARRFMAEEKGAAEIPGRVPEVPPEEAARLAREAEEAPAVEIPARPRVPEVPEVRRVVGSTVQAMGPDPNKVYDFRYRVVELDDLVTSHTDRGILNPDYPQGLQPRDRARAASEAQLTEIVTRFVPEEFVDDRHVLDRGPVIIGPDMAVESGNIRTVALRRLRQMPGGFEQYKQPMLEALPGYGIDPQEVSGLRYPVLVRERVTEFPSFEARQAFAEEANQPSVLGMAPVEMAAGDARRISDEDVASIVAVPGEAIEKTLRRATNRPIVQSFLNSFPTTQRAVLQDRAGWLNQAGMQRLKGALLLRTYGGEPGRQLADIFLESLDSDIRRVEHGVFSSLAQMAQAEALIAAGQRRADLSVSEDLAKVVSVLARLRQAGTPVDRYLAQATMFERELTGFQEGLLKHLDIISRSSRRVREFLIAYAEEVRATTAPAQRALMPMPEPSKGDLLDRAARTSEAAEVPQRRLFAALEEAEAAPAPAARAGLEEVEARRLAAEAAAASALEAPAIEPRFMPGVEPPRYYEMGARGMNPRMMETLRAARDAARRIGTVGELVSDPTLQARFADILDVEVWASPWFRQTGLLGETQWDLEGVLEGGEPNIRIYLSPRAPETTIIDELAHAQGYRRGAEPGGEAFRRAATHAEPGQAPYGEAVPEVPGYRPPAEPVVPPPAAAAPAVAAPPAVGLGPAIPGQPPVGAAAVPPEVAPRPPVEPLPPEVPPPGSAELPGLVTRPPTAPDRLAPILDSSEILAMQRRPDVWRRMMTFAETHQLTPLVRLMQSVGISGTDPAREAMMVGSFVAAEGRVAAIGAVSELRAFGNAQKLFGATDMVVRYKGKDYLLGDIVEGMHPELPLTPDQLRYIQMGWELGDELHAFAQAEGVDIPLVDYPEGQHWWHRDTVFQRHANGTIDVALVDPGPGGRYIAAMMGLERPRQFDSMADARVAGFHHLDPTDAMQVAVQQVYRRIADERVKAHVLEFIASRTERPARWGEVELPGMRGRLFQAEEVGPVMDWLGETRLSWADNVATAINIMNDAPRTLLTSLDAGPAFLQLLGTVTNYPVVWTRAVLKGWHEVFSPGAVARFLSMPEHAATLRKYAPYGLNAQGSRLTAGARGIWAEHGILGKIPLLGKGVRVGSAIFDDQMLLVRIMGLEATEYQIKTRDDVGTLVRFWNTFTGACEPGSYGITRSQQLKESAFLFAPRLQRATLSIMADIFQGGLRGSLARDSLGKMGAVGLITYLAICNALDQRPRLNPKTEGSRWMTVKVGDQYVGIGGPYFMNARTLIRMAMSPEDAREIAGTFVRSRLSPVVSTGIDVLTQKDAIAMPVPTSIPELSLYVLKNNLVPIWLQGVIESGATSWEDYIGVSAMELMGLRVFPVSPARKRDEIRDRLAQATFGRPWGELSRPQTYQLEQVPELSQVTEEARALGRKRETPWALFWADVESQREPYRVEIAQVTQQFRRNELSGNQYRDAVQERQMIMARIPDMLRNTRDYAGIDFARPAAQNPVDEFIDAYYQIADQTRDPLTGMADARQIVMDREALKQRTDAAVVREAMQYINRKLDPEYVQARDLYYEYMRIPQYSGLNEDEAQLANEAMRTYRAMRRANPQMDPNWTRAYLSRYNPEGYKLMMVAQHRRNPERRRFWAEHPLLSKFYGDLTTEELELVLPEENLWQAQPQAQLPAFAPPLAYGR